MCNGIIRSSIKLSTADMRRVVSAACATEAPDEG